MSATMARQGGRVQLEPSDMHLALNMAKMANRGFLCAAVEETQFLIKKPFAEVREEKKRGVEIPGLKNVKAAMQRHPAMLRDNQTGGCLPCQNATEQNPQTSRRDNGTGAPRPGRLRQPTPEPSPHPPGTPPVPPGDNEADHVCEIKGEPARYGYFHTPLPSTQFFNHDA